MAYTNMTYDNTLLLHFIIRFLFVFVFVFYDLTTPITTMCFCSHTKLYINKIIVIHVIHVLQ